MATPRAFERGQRVKLAETYARALMLKRSMDWLHRRGTVRYCSPATVYIQWDGRATMDTVPVRGVTLAEHEIPVHAETETSAA